MGCDTIQDWVPVLYEQPAFRSGSLPTPVREGLPPGISFSGDGHGFTEMPLVSANGDHVPFGARFQGHRFTIEVRGVQWGDAVEVRAQPATGPPRRAGVCRRDGSHGSRHRQGGATSTDRAGAIGHRPIGPWLDRPPTHRVESPALKAFGKPPEERSLRRFAESWRFLGERLEADVSALSHVRRLRGDRRHRGGAAEGP